MLQELSAEKTKTSKETATQVMIRLSGLHRKTRTRGLTRHISQASQRKASFLERTKQEFQKVVHPWRPGTFGSWALRNPPPKSPCQALPTGSQTVGSKASLYRAILVNNYILSGHDTYVSDAVSSLCPRCSSLSKGTLSLPPCLSSPTCSSFCGPR